MFILEASNRSCQPSGADDALDAQPVVMTRLIET